MLIIKKTDNIDKKLEEFIKDIPLPKKPIFIFDIHKTTLNKNGTINEEIKLWIEKLIKKEYNLFFLSYDGQEKRIPVNYKLLRKEKLYRNIPTIFMMKRKKQLVLLSLVNLIDIDKRYKIKATLVDDNPMNINDVNKLKKDYLKAIKF
tara:strand:- start:41 stop:484 length:444 start_codon:yes stop_codon:yes gene_type:complete